MTQEEIQQKAYEAYPLDLDRHFIIEGEPYDNNKEKREAYIRGLTDSKLSIPSNLDEAAKKYELSIGSQDYCYLDIEDAFKAGAEWMAEQGYIKEGIARPDDCEIWVNFTDADIKDGDEVIVQIRKK